MEDLKVRYLGQEIVIPGDFLLAREIQTQFEKLANQAEASYMADCYDKYKNYQTFSANGIEDGYEHIFQCIDTAAEILIKNGVYYADGKMLINKYGEEIFHEWMFLEAAVNVKQDQAQAKVEADRQAREYRKASRGRMVGGGFGVKGAAKGIAMAGTYNFASGLLHSGVNAIGNSISRSKSQKELQHLYENELRESVSVAIHTCVQVIGVIVIAELGLDVPDGIEERVTTLFNNFPKVPKEDQPVVAAQIITLAPWDVRTYMLLLPKFGDPDGELYRLAKQASAGMLTSFNSARKDVLSKTIKSLQPKISALVAKTAIEDFDSTAFLEEQDKFLNIIKEKAIWLGYKPGDDTTIQNLKSLEWEVAKLCREKEEASRTANGVVYKTRELAEKARENFQQAQKLAQASKNADYQQICDNLQKLRAIDDQEPSGTAFDFIMEVEELESNARTVADVEYATYELATKAKANRNMANQLIADCSKGAITKDKLLSKVYGLNQAEPKGSLTDILDKILVQFFDRKEDTDSKMFRKVSYQTELERQTVECEFLLFLIAHPLATNTEEELIQLIDQADHDAKHAAIDPLTRTELERYLAAMREKTLKKMQNNAQKAIRAKKQAKADIYRVAFGIFSLVAMIFLPLVKVSGTSCTFIGIIQAMGNDSDLLFGGVILILTYVVFWGAIIRYILEPLQMLAMVIGFVVVVGGVCLIGGSAYNASIWLYILLGGGIAGYALGN